jgi:nitrate reductase NapE component
MNELPKLQDENNADGGTGNPSTFQVSKSKRTKTVLIIFAFIVLVLVVLAVAL